MTILLHIKYYLIMAYIRDFIGTAGLLRNASRYRYYIICVR